MHIDVFFSEHINTPRKPSVLRTVRSQWTLHLILLIITIWLFFLRLHLYPCPSLLWVWVRLSLMVSLLLVCVCICVCKRQMPCLPFGHCKISKLSSICTQIHRVMHSVLMKHPASCLPSKLLQLSYAAQPKVHYTTQLLYLKNYKCYP